MSKPREFWIRADSHKIDGVFYAWNDNQEHFDCINVIEKKAYDALLAQNKRLVEALEFYANGDHLEMPSFDNNIIEPAVIDDGEIARQALSKVKGEAK